MVVVFYFEWVERRHAWNRPEIKLIEEKDTAEVARRIKEKGLKGIAAVASKMAANMYDLAVLADDIQTIKNNSTRLFILKKNNDSPYHPSKLGSVKDKASIKFETKHDSGSLAEILDIFGKHDLNLTKIQSLPIIDKPWNYAFFIELVIDDCVLYKNALHLISKKVTHLKILGEYHQNKL